jgi:hypothetical protein
VVEVKRPMTKRQEATADPVPLEEYAQHFDDL